MEFPCGLDDASEVGVLGLPAQFGVGLGGVGGQHGRVAGAAGLFGDLEVLARDLFDGVDDLAYGVAVAVAQVVDQFGFLIEFAQGQQVSEAEVFDVDVIADAGAVGGVVVRAEDLDVFTFAHGGLDDQGDQVRLGAVVFADGTVTARAAGVEVTQGGVVETTGPGLPMQHAFRGPLGFTIGIDGAFGQGFVNGDDLGHAVGSGGTAEDELAYVGVFHGLQDRVGVADIVMVVTQGLLHGFAHLDEGGKVHDGFYMILFEGLDQQGVVGQVTLDKVGRADGGPVALAEVVVDHGVMAFVGEEGDHVAADISGSATD